MEELCEIIKELGIKTMREDPIPAKLLKSLDDETVLPVLTKLINKTLNKGSMNGLK